MKSRFTDWSALAGFRPVEAPPSSPPPEAPKPRGEEPLPSMLAEMLGAEKPTRRPAAKPAAPEPDREAELDATVKELAAECARLERELEEARAGKARLEGELEAARATEAGWLKSIADAKAETAKFQRAAAERERADAERIAELATASAAERPVGGAMALVDRPEGFREAFPGELREHVLASLVEQMKIAANGGRTRRERALEAVLDANPSSGEFERRRSGIERILKEAGRFVDDRAIAELGRLGFRYVTGNNHHKLDYMGERFTVAKTPGDRRSLVNTALDIVNRVF